MAATVRRRFDSAKKTAINRTKHMKTINCRIRLHEYSDVAGIGITPAEAVVLQQLHGANAGGPVIQKPVASGEVDRTDKDEVARLVAKYPVRGKSGEAVAKELFPGAFPKLPETFAEVGIEGVQAPEEPAAPRKSRKSAEPAATPE